MNKTLQKIALILLFIIGSAAFYGSWHFISDPSGKSIKISIKVLDGTPFNDFLIPGIILLFANGFLSLLTAVLTIKKTKYYPWFIILQGWVLIGWLTTEIFFNTDMLTPIMHYPLYTMGGLLIVTGLFIEKKHA